MITDASTTTVSDQQSRSPDYQLDKPMDNQPTTDRVDGQALHTETHRDADLARYPESIRPALLAMRELSRIVVPLRPSEWAQLNLTMGQLKTLMLLASQPGIGITQLAETLAIGKPTASTLVDQLVQAGYVRRIEDPADRRRAIVTPTAEGDDLVLRLRQDRERLTHWLTQMEADDLATLTRGLHALIAVAARQEKPAAIDNR